MAMTQQDIARKLNVSQMTVSRALRGVPGVSESTRREILRFAKRHGYSLEINHAARMMRSRARGETPANSIICVLAYDSPDRFQDHTFHGAIFKGVREAADKEGFEVVYAVSRLAEPPLLVQRGQVDAIIQIMARGDIDNPGPEPAVPRIAIMLDPGNSDAVVTDSRDGGVQIGRHLGELGHRRVAWFGSDAEVSEERLAGIRDGLAASGGGIDDRHVFRDKWAGGYESGRRLTERFLDAVEDPEASGVTAVCVYNDAMAVAVVDELTKRGVSVPEQVSVTGFDGVDTPSYTGPRLTTAAAPLMDMGGEAIRLAFARLQTPEASRRRLVLPSTLRVGESTAQAPS